MTVALMNVALMDVALMNVALQPDAASCRALFLLFFCPDMFGLRSLLLLLLLLLLFGGRRVVVVAFFFAFHLHLLSFPLP